jgi:AraC-like DNA-binding protein
MTVLTTGRLTRAAIGDPIGGGLPEWQLRRVTQYIEQNLQRPLRLDELGAVLHVSPYHFAHLFKRRTGVSPHRFILLQRIERARILLAAPVVPIAAVARSVGFRTPSYFSATFRRITGVTPSGYRRSEEAERAGTVGMIGSFALAEPTRTHFGAREMLMNPASSG